MLKKISLILILLLSLFLRLYHLDTLPPSLFSDEVDISYQARIFNQNHTDYFGNKFPIHFHSFADWQPSLGIYFTSLFQSITNNFDTSVRLLSAFFGLISIIFLYLITGSTIPAFLMAISPWAIHYNRTGFAVSAMLAVLLAGIYFWKKYTQTSRLSTLLLSVFFFILSPYFYSTSNLFLLIIALLVLILWFSKIKKMPLRHILIASIFSLLLLSPLVINTLKGRAGFRFSYINIFSEPQLAKTTDYLRYRDIFTTHQNETGVSPSLASKVFHNKYGLIIDKFFNNYFSAFSSDFLFITGDQNARHGFATHGLLYYLDFFLIIFGLINILKNRHQDRFAYLFVLILFLAPIPFALTRDSIGPHATRLILMLPSLIYLTYNGILYLKFLFKWSLPVLIGLYLISFTSFWHYYNYDYPQESAMTWHSGMKEAVLATNKYSQPLYFSNAYEPFLPFFLYYQPYLPQHAPANDITHFANDIFDGSTINQQFYFGHINWSNISKLNTPSIFIVSDVDQNQVPKNLKLLETINKKYINSQNFYLYTNE